MKKILTLLLVLCSMFLLASCGNDADEKHPEPTACVKVEGRKVKAGLICLHDENSTYDKNFIDAFKAACAIANVEGVIVTNIPEGSECYEKACELAESGCDLVFADSFGHESYLLQAAKEYKDVHFCHATGTMAHTQQVGNLHNAFASIYEGRYLAGVAAGLKLKEMMDADASLKPVVGYVGAFTYAEVISGYTSWFLGVQSIVPTATMKVQFTGSWYDETAEKSAALALIKAGCVIISQHADSWGAPTACETANVPNVSYNGSTESKCPNTFIVSSKINWAPYFEYCFNAAKNGTAIAYDWTGTMSTLSVLLTEYGAKAPAKGTAAAVALVAAELASGARKVFDCSKFTVDGKHLTEYLADVNSDPNYTKDTNVIKTVGDVTYFAESEFRSAPYFDITIDGIELLNAAY